MEKEPSESDSDMELDLVSGKEALSVENKDNVIGQWENLLRKWEDEKTEKLKHCLTHVAGKSTMMKRMD